MTRETSIEAYHYLVDSGGLTAARARSYGALYARGPCTASELYAFVKKSEQRGAIVARLGELRDMGVVQELDPRPCSITEMTAIVWDVTSRVYPLRPARPTTNAEKLRGYRVLVSEIIVWMKDAGFPDVAEAARQTAADIEEETR